jgi:hypothetical protein
LQSFDEADSFRALVGLCRTRINSAGPFAATCHQAFVKNRRRFPVRQRITLDGQVFRRLRFRLGTRYKDVNKDEFGSCDGGGSAGAAGLVTACGLPQLVEVPRRREEEHAHEEPFGRSAREIFTICTVAATTAAHYSPYAGSPNRICGVNE